MSYSGISISEYLSEEHQYYFWSTRRIVDNTTLSLYINVSIVDPDSTDNTNGLLDIDVAVSQSYAVGKTWHTAWITKPTILVDHPTYTSTDDGLLFAFNGISKPALIAFCNKLVETFNTQTYAACVFALIKKQAGSAEEPCNSCPKQLICLGARIP